MKTFRLGLIGFGGWAKQAYAPVLAEMSEVEVAAVAARSEASHAAAKDVFGQRLSTFERYQDLLAERSIDAVMVALPNSLHAETIQAAVAAGKHVFFEPPVAESAAEAERVFRALARTDRVAQADLELRCLPVMKAVVDRIASGEVGRPRMAQVRLWCDWGYRGGAWGDEVQGQSFFLWLGCWYLDVLDCIFSATPTRASVMGGYASNGQLMDYGWASLAYPEGGVGQFEFNLTAAQGTSIELRVGCEEGEIDADLKSGEYRLRGSSGDWRSETRPASEPAHGFEGMRESIQSFVASLERGVADRSQLELIRRVQVAAQLCADAERADRDPTSPVRSRSG